jgi:hypothetical protein
MKILNLDFNQRLKTLIVCALTLLFVVAAYAEKKEGYVPPPFSYRLLCSFNVLMPFAVFTLIFCCLYFKIVDKSIGKIKFAKLFIAMLIPLVLSCYMAAGDEINDEGWNPASMALLIPVYVPFVIPVLGEKLTRLYRILIGICLFILLTIAIGYSELPVQDFLAKTTIPCTW